MINLCDIVSYWYLQERTDITVRILVVGTTTQDKQALTNYNL